MSEAQVRARCYALAVAIRKGLGEISDIAGESIEARAEVARGFLQAYDVLKEWLDHHDEKFSASIEDVQELSESIQRELDAAGIKVKIDFKENEDD